MAEWIPIEAPVLDLSAPPFYTAVLARVNKIINMYMRDAVHFIVAHHRLDHASALVCTYLILLFCMSYHSRGRRLAPSTYTSPPPKINRLRGLD